MRSGEVARTVSAPARVAAAARQTVAASVAGTVTAIEVEDGDEVTSGQLVVRLSAAEGTPASELTVEAPFAGTVSLEQSSEGGTAVGLPELGGLPQGPAPAGGGPLRRGSRVSPARRCSRSSTCPSCT